jgi:hypothetical protein
MTFEKVEIIQLWVREKGKWQRKSPRFHFAPAGLKQAGQDWRGSRLRLLRFLMTSPDVSGLEVPRKARKPITRPVIAPRRRITKAALSIQRLLQIWIICLNPVASPFGSMATRISTSITSSVQPES